MPLLVIAGSVASIVRIHMRMPYGSAKDLYGRYYIYVLSQHMFLE